jgi:hypothetical protein
VQGRDISIDVTRTIEQHGDVMHIIDQAQTPGGAIADTFVVDAETLMPQRRSTKQGPATISLDYGEGQITGSMDSPMGQADIDQALDAPVVGESGALDVYLAALPLAEGYTATFRTFSLQQRQVRPMQVAVTGTESVEVPAGTFEAYVVEVTPLDGNDTGASTMYIATDAPHTVVKSTSKLPAQMGGGMATTTLTGMETAGSN